MRVCSASLRHRLVAETSRNMDSCKSPSPTSRTCDSRGDTRLYAKNTDGQKSTRLGRRPAFLRCARRSRDDSIDRRNVFVPLSDSLPRWFAGLFELYHKRRPMMSLSRETRRVTERKASLSAPNFSLNTYIFICFIDSSNFFDR